MTTATERAWAAGFFDGEGSVARVVDRRVRSVPEGRVRYPNVNITQAGASDAPPDTLVRFLAAVDVTATIHGPIFITRRKPRYQISISNAHDVMKIYQALRPYLSSEKLRAFEERIAEADAVRAAPLPRRTKQERCQRGHVLADPNIYYSAAGNRRCRECQLMTSRDQRRRQRDARASSADHSGDTPPRSKKR